MDQKVIPLALRTPGSQSISIGGLNKQDRERIARVGLTKWLDEVCDGKNKRASK
jgi:hypothetical protein